MPQNPQNRIIQTELKHYDQFRSVSADTIRWLQINTDTGKKPKLKTRAKEKYQQLLDFITIDVLNIEQQYCSDQENITLPMTQFLRKGQNTTHHPALTGFMYSFTSITTTEIPIRQKPQEYNNVLFQIFTITLRTKILLRTSASIKFKNTTRSSSYLIWLRIKNSCISPVSFCK